MERALSTEIIELALGNSNLFPSTDDFTKKIAEAELSLLLGNYKVDESLLNTGWYLHAIATSKVALELYGLDRQRAAFKNSAHIFDIIIKDNNLSKIEKLKYCFAAQIAYIRSELNPNAIALYNQNISGELSNDLSIINDGSEVSLSCGVGLLSYNLDYNFKFTKKISNEINFISSNWLVNSIEDTPYSSVAYLVLAIRKLLFVLIFGKFEHIDIVKEYLKKSINSEIYDTQTSKWVAAHILNLLDDLKKSSIWTILPPDAPNKVKRAFTLGKPRVLTLWPPQISILSNKEGETSPISDRVKRLFLSTPTSSGKTLLAQIIITYFIGKNKKSVFFVAPTRSLCREVRNDLDSRLKFLGVNVTDDISLTESSNLNEIHVEVMTSERLSFLLRLDSQKVLESVGMFIFDEVHNLNDNTRGFLLEQNISYLHYLTINSNHKIILISAVIGNRNNFTKWIEGQDQKEHSYSDWSAPRKLYSIFDTKPKWEDTIQKEINTKNYKKEEITPLYGRLTVKISNIQRELTTKEKVGDLIFKIKKADDQKEKDKNNSTQFYKMLVTIINYLGNSGPVLIIESTRSSSTRMAKAIADSLEVNERLELQELQALIKSRLGEMHPLFHLIPKGVGFHYSSLPHEIRLSLEDAVRNGIIQYLVATTTMTEGINIPVKSVVIASQGAYDHSKEYKEYISGSKLINAIGRAGRATKETEGIVVLAKNSSALISDEFLKLVPVGNENIVKSNLTNEEVLNIIISLEEEKRALEDLIFEIDNTIISDFISFVWFVLSEIEFIKKATINIESLTEIFKYSLAWGQLNDESKKHWLRISDLVLQKYQKTSLNNRKKWASSGMSINSAIKLEELKIHLINKLNVIHIEKDNIIELLSFILDDFVLDKIRHFREYPKFKVFTNRTGKNRKEINIPLKDLLHDWINGVEIYEISKKYFSEIEDVDFQFEQLGDYIYKYFEIFLNQFISNLTIQINQSLKESSSLLQFPNNLSNFIKWGVGNYPALELISNGLAYRVISMKIANTFLSKHLSISILEWIKGLSINEINFLFSPSKAEISQLLKIYDGIQNSTINKLLESGEIHISIEILKSDIEFNDTIFEFKKVENNSEKLFEIVDQNKGVIGIARSESYYQLEAIISLGLEIKITYISENLEGKLRISLDEG